MNCPCPRPDGPHARADTATRFASPERSGLTQGRAPGRRGQTGSQPKPRGSVRRPLELRLAGRAEHGRPDQKTSGEVSLLWVTLCLRLCCSTPGSRWRSVPAPRVRPGLCVSPVRRRRSFPEPLSVAREIFNLSALEEVVTDFPQTSPHLLRAIYDDLTTIPT